MSSVKPFWSTWQFRTTLLICACAPALGDFIVFVTVFVGRLNSATTAPPMTLLEAVAGFLFSLPVAYTFAAIPALAVGTIYCSTLTAFPTLKNKLIGRTLLAALIGGFVLALWCWMLHWRDGWFYGSGAAVTSGILALRWPRIDRSDL